jgi:hypothetical protein
MLSHVVCLLSCLAGEQLYDNNGGQDFVYKTTAGITWEEWQAAALERQEEQEKERHAAEEVGDWGAKAGRGGAGGGGVR